MFRNLQILLFLVSGVILVALFNFEIHGGSLLHLTMQNQMLIYRTKQKAAIFMRCDIHCK